MATSNAIVLENQKPGNPQNEWDLSGAPSTSIEGFSTDISVNHGSPIDFKISTDSTNYRIDIYRLGYYGGDGARLVGSIQHQSVGPDFQPAALTDTITGLVDAGNWHVTDSWAVPADAVSGVYIAKLVRQDGISGENHIPFIVRADESHSDVVFQTSDATWQAYNTWGGNNVYDGEDTIAVSYNRPTPTHQPTNVTNNPGGTSLGNYLFGAEYPAIYWLEKNGYDISYISTVDTARDGASLLDHKLFISAGHDEYWSAEQRANVEAARDAGVNLAFWSGNEVYWKTRWDVSFDPSHTNYRTMVSYKDHGIDPSGIWTGRWADPNGVTGGAVPQNALTGQFFTVNYPGSPDPLVVPFADSQLRFWRDTSVANTQPGGAYLSPAHYLGFEIDSSIDNGYQPAGLIELSHTSTNVVMYGGLPGSLSTFGPGTATHSLTLYRAPSGALVFGAGSVFWSWALDAHHDNGPPWPDGASAPVDPNIQQAMVNLFADMGIQPGSLQANLQHATSTTDFTPPQSTITGLAAATYTGSQWEIYIGGNAVDVGGHVAGMSVSLDNGASWHSATWDGVANWAYHWAAPQVATTYSVMYRSVDDSVNLESPLHVVAATIDFSMSGYLSSNPDVAAIGIDAYQHYHQWGWKEGRNPNPNFDTKLYLLNNPDVAAANVDPYEHFLLHGLGEGRTAMPAIQSAWGGISDQDFDGEYYLLMNPDVGAAGVDPYQHYLQNGWHEGRSPNAYFDVQYYLAQNSDVANYLAQNPGVPLDPLAHYHLWGWREGRNPSATFDTDTYLAANPDVSAADIDPLMHFLKWGAFEGRLA